MTGAEHYKRAENLLRDLLKAECSMSGRRDPHDLQMMLAKAQVHATLALAAATAINASDTSVPIPDWEAWKAVAGEQGERS